MPRSPQQGLYTLLAGTSLATPADVPSSKAQMRAPASGAPTKESAIACDTCYSADMTLPQRRTEDLHRGRVSIPDARYFITCCAIRPTHALTNPATAPAILEAMDGLGEMLCATIMPDHIHALIQLDGRLTVGQCVGRLKSLTRAAPQGYHAHWQRDFFEHRLRPEDGADDYARYIFMNPYRASLLARRATWPWWRRGKNHDFDFLSLLEDGQFPQAAWFTEDWTAMGLQSQDVGID